MMMMTALLMSKKAATRLDDDDLLIPTRKKRKNKNYQICKCKKISRHAVKNASDFMGQVADFNKYHKHVFILPMS